MIEYVAISSTGNISGAKKYDVLTLNTPVPLPEIPTSVEATLNGTTVVSMGVGKLVWDFELLVRYVDARSGYGSVVDIVSLFSNTDPSTNLLKFQDWRNTTVYDVFLVNKGETDVFELKSATTDSNDSIYIVKMKLRQA